MEADLSKPPGEQVTYTPIHREAPLGVSKPQLSQAVALEASAFVEARLTVLIDGLIGPYVGARANANFSLTPLANPWWKFNADLDLTGGFVLNFLGVQIADVGDTIQGPTLFERDAARSRGRWPSSLGPRPGLG